jgi:hypothetical protein
MKSTFKLLGGIAAVVAIMALMAPAVQAQCPAARQFAGITGGKTSAVVNVDVSGFADTGNEFAQFWQAGNPSNGTGVGDQGSCPSQGVGTTLPWWQVVGTVGGLRGVRGFVAQPGCTLPVCPGDGASLSFLIEDQTSDGSDCGFIMYSVDETPAANRWYDLGRVDPNGAAGTVLTQPMGSYPAVIVTSSSGPPPTTVATNDYADVGILFHGVQGAGNTPLPASAQITTYDVMSASGGDPGRNRADWTLVHSVQYADADIISDTVAVPCSGDVDTVLAIGITFDNDILSSCVGAASLPIACDPNVALPDAPIRRRSITGPSSGRSGR